eukprot:GILI01046548.1.p1 GENE.GILI01046548.1~~GILI01046548.1.p1  ORF type:complete len:190 (+),score=17.45 GILI01046548.1:60-572(+)
MAVPWLLFITSFVAAKIGSCDTVLLTSGVVYALYALSIAVARPYLGWLHNAVEGCMSIGAAVCLIIWYSVFDHDASSTGGLPTSELACVTILVAISNCRFPFTLARALRVVLPKLVSMKSNLSTPNVKTQSSPTIALSDTEDNVVSGEVAYHDEVEDEEDTVLVVNFGDI